MTSNKLKQLLRPVLYPFWIWFFPIFLILFFLTGLPVMAVDCGNTLDRNIELEELKGGWLFQKGDNILWKENYFNDTSWQRKNLPENGKDKSVKSYGFYWVRCHLYLPSGGLRESSLAIHLGKIRDADEVYLNGNLIGSHGKLNPLVSDIEAYRIYSLPSHFLLEGENVLAVRIFSSTPYYGLMHVPQIGRERKIMESVARSEAFMVVSGAVFILMGLFFIMGSVVKSKNQSNLYFSLFSIFLGMYTLLRTNFRYVIFDNFALSYQVELVILCFLPLIFINFFNEFINIKRSRIYHYAYDMLILVFALYIILFGKTPEKWLRIIDTNILLLLLPLTYISYLMKKLHRAYRKRLKHVFIGMIGLFPCIVIDSIRALDIFPLPPTLHFGFMFFLINISIELSEEMVENYKNYIKQESELMKMERVKTKFLYNISTEFKSYLDRAQTLVRELKEEIPTEKTLQDKLLILESLSGLSKTMIDDAIILNSLESEEFEIYTERFFFKDLLLEVIMMIEIRHRQDRLTTNFSISGKDLEIQHNKELIFLVFYHILENIFVYTPEDSAVNLSFEEKEGRLIVRLEDNGPGIPFEEQKDIFKKFVRGSKALSSEVHGVGIGLTLVQTICNSVDGSIQLQSTPGSGTVVTVSLPVFF
ncbi:MAG: hypothetical protein H7A24_12750 [Leptospiraceae bacterium]|nr:hypothetical protein [Leptospiraceae bacterium]